MNPKSSGLERTYGYPHGTDKRSSWGLSLIVLFLHPFEPSDLKPIPSRTFPPDPHLDLKVGSEGHGKPIDPYPLRVWF